MPLRTTLLVARKKLKAELSYAQQEVATQNLELNYLLESTQNWLALNHDWPQLRVELLVDIAATSRYLTMDSRLNLGRPLNVYVCYKTNWCGVETGITPDDYNEYDSTIGEQGPGPIAKWQLYNWEATQKFEVWPIPAEAQKMSFVGQRIPATLRNDQTGDFDDTKILELDDELVVLFAAAEKTASLKLANAGLKAQRAARLLEMLRSHMPLPTNRLVFGGKDEPTSNRKLVKIAVA